MFDIFLLVSFFKCKENSFEPRKNVFYFTSEALFFLKIIKF